MGSRTEGTVVYIGLGSNLGDRIAHLRNAVNAIKHLGDLIAVSSLYESEPFGVGDEQQPMYLNMVLSIRTDLSPQRLLSELLKIELLNGRVRHRRYESRTLDLDILMYGNKVIKNPELVIPHPRMHERAFVMLPLSEIAPDSKHPTLGLTMARISEGLANQGVRSVGTIDDVATTAISPVLKPE